MSSRQTTANEKSNQLREASISFPVPNNLPKKRQQEIYRHLCIHNGPDEEGKAHPVNRTVLLEDLAPALEAAQSEGFCLDLKPYHFPKTRGIWEQPDLVDEIITKQVNSLLKEKYNDDFLTFCANVQARDLLQPLQETVGDRTFTVSVLQPIGAIFQSSPYKVAMRYIELTKQTKKYAGLRPYHFSAASQGTYEGKDVALEVLSKKIKSLLRNTYRYDLARLCSSIDQDELLAPFEDKIGSGTISVKMGMVSHVFQDNIYQMLMVYIKAEGREAEFQELKPYHLRTSSQSTYKNPQYTREVIVKSCHYQVANRFGGDESAFLRHATLPQITEDFWEIIAGRQMRVVTDSAVKIFGESSTRIKKLFQRYREEIQLAA